MQSKPNCNWLTSAVEATIYSTPTWQPIQDDFCRQLATYIRSRQPEGAQVVQGMMMLTGEHFSNEYLSDIKSQRELLYEPFMSDDQRAKFCNRLRAELQQWSKQKSEANTAVDFRKAVVKIIADAALESYVKPVINRASRRSRIILDDNARTAVVQDVAAQSEKLAEGLVALYERYPGLGYDPKTLIGLKLCPTLRSFVWERRLSQHALTERIRISLAETMTARNMASADASPLKPLIERIFVTVAKDRDFISETLYTMFQDRSSILIDVMNRYHIFTGKYGARYCALLLNMIQAFPKLNDAEKILSRYVALTNQRPLLAISEFAEEVVRRLAQSDPVLHEHATHLGRSSLLNANLDRGAKGLAISLNLSRIIAKWLEYGFVGFLQPDALIFIWDQCMLIGWDPTMADCCLAILELLRPRILQASTIEELDRIIVIETAELTLKSVRELFLKLTASNGQKTNQ